MPICNHRIKVMLHGNIVAKCSLYEMWLLNKTFI